MDGSEGLSQRSERLSRRKSWVVAEIGEVVTEEVVGVVVGEVSTKVVLVVRIGEVVAKVVEVVTKVVRIGEIAAKVVAKVVKVVETNLIINTILRLYRGHFPLLPEGQRPDWAALMCAICFGEAPEPPAAASEEFRDFVARCLEKKAGRRASVAELLEHPFVAERDAAAARQALAALVAEAD